MKRQMNNIENQVEKERVDTLYRRSTPASLTLLFIGTLYSWVIFGEYDSFTIGLWYFSLFVVAGLRYLTMKLYFSKFNEKYSLEFWLNLFRVGICLAGVTIGSLNVFFFAESTVTSFIAILVPYCVLAGSVPVLLDKFSFFIYSLSLLSPIAYQLLLIGGKLNDGIVLLTVIYCAFLFRFNKANIKQHCLNLKLVHDNSDLLNSIKREKNKLSSRLGRILDDSTTEIYVVDIESLMCLQVNRGAAEKLGYLREEFVNINILDVFVDLDAAGLASLFGPIYKGEVSLVKYKGKNKCADGSIFPVEASFQLTKEEGSTIIVVNVQDITERTEWEQELLEQVNHDQLTGIFNRHYMQSYMQIAFSSAKQEGRKLALLYIDLDNFKDINDSLGHNFGDELLKGLTSRIASFLQDGQIIARTGGDEFVIVVENVGDHDFVETFADNIAVMIREPFYIHGREIYSSASIGISMFPDDGDNYDQIMQYADIAMYKAKENGGDTYSQFTADMRKVSEEKMLLTNHLRYAFTNDEFSLVYQPKVDMRDGRIIGSEALIRWTNKEFGPVSPVVFIPLAESMGLIGDIGAWVLMQACKEAKHWLDTTGERIKVSVNVSSQQFKLGSLKDDVHNAIAESGLPFELLELEITESLLLHDSDSIIRLLQSLVDKGISIAIDDFGTGYSSLSYLLKFPITVLKVDRTFICDDSSDQNSKSLVGAIISMGRGLNLDIIAEGVETEAQLEFLRGRFVDIIQGYYYSCPLPTEEFLQLIKEKKFESDLANKLIE